MGIEVAKTTIGGLNFELSQLPVWEALPAFHRFLAIAGQALPTITTVARALKGRKMGELSGEDAALLLEAVSGTLPLALAKAAPGEVLELSKVLLAPCLVKTPDGKLVRLLDVADSLLAGRLPVLLQLIGWAVKVHFGSFLPGLASIGALATPATG